MDLPWDDEQLADLAETITAARAEGNAGRAELWEDVRDGAPGFVDYTEFRVGLFTKHGMEPPREPVFDLTDRA